MEMSRRQFYPLRSDSHRWGSRLLDTTAVICSDGAIVEGRIEGNEKVAIVHSSVSFSWSGWMWLGKGASVHSVWMGVQRG